MKQEMNYHFIDIEGYWITMEGAHLCTKVFRTKHMHRYVASEIVRLNPTYDCYTTLLNKLELLLN